MLITELEPKFFIKQTYWRVMEKSRFQAFQKFNFKGYDPVVAIGLTLESGYNARVFNKYPIKYSP
jgi:hypothetical protein